MSFHTSPRLFAILVLLLSMSLAACQSEEDKARDTAINYLEYEWEGKRASSYELVSTADREAKPKKEYMASSAFAESIRSAFEGKVSYEAKDVTVDGDTATVIVAETAPSIMAMDRDDADTDDVPLSTNERVYELVKEDGAWRVDTDWAEQKEKEAELKRQREIAEKASELLDEAEALVSADKLEDAKAKLDEALELDPELSRANEALEAVEEQLAKIVAGRWRVEYDVSEMTDDKNAYAYLPSENVIDGSFGTKKRATIYVRCREGDLSAYIALPSTGSLTANDYRRGTPVRVRYDDDDAKRVYMNRGNSSESLFPKRTDPFLAELRQADRFRVEVPMIGSTELWRYDLVGIDKALKPVYETCGKNL